MPGKGDRNKRRGEWQNRGETEERKKKEKNAKRRTWVR